MTPELGGLLSLVWETVKRDRGVYCLRSKVSLAREISGEFEKDEGRIPEGVCRLVPLDATTKM
jgi:hypothetical protein